MSLATGADGYGYQGTFKLLQQLSGRFVKIAKIGGVAMNRLASARLPEVARYSCRAFCHEGGLEIAGYSTKHGIGGFRLLC